MIVAVAFFVKPNLHDSVFPLRFSRSLSVPNPDDGAKPHRRGENATKMFAASPMRVGRCTRSDPQRRQPRAGASLS